MDIPLSPTLGDARPETPLHEDPLLGITMLPSSGEGENSMKVFIQEHLTFILQPLAETVTDIQKSIRKIKDDTAHANGISERNMEHISAHEQKLVLVNAAVQRCSDDVTNQRKDTSEVLDRIVNVEGELDLTKVGLNKMEGYVTATANASHDYRKMIDDIDARVRQVQLSVSETNVYHMAFTDRLSEIRNLHDGLNDRHMQMVTTLQQVKQSDENTRAVVKRHISTVDKQKKDVQRSFTLLDDRLKVVEGMVLETNHKTQQTAKGLKKIELGLKDVLGEMSEVVGVQQGLNQTTATKTSSDAQSPQPAKAAQAPENPTNKFANRMGRIEESISLLHRNQAFEKDAAATWKKEVDEMIKKSVVDMRENTLHLELATKNAKGNEDRVLRNENRIIQLESNVDKVMKLSEKAGEDTERKIVNGPIRDLQAVVEFEKLERDKTNTHLAHVEKSIEPIRPEIQMLNKEVIDMQGAMSKIAMRAELAHEYMQGVSKGFQDTQKRVSAGLDGMMPPKTITNRKMLPEIPGSKSSQREAPSPQP